MFPRKQLLFVLGGGRLGFRVERGWRRRKKGRKKLILVIKILYLIKYIYIYEFFTFLFN